MREIKFRAWDGLGWRDDVIATLDGKFRQCQLNQDGMSATVDTNKRFIVSQYTGVVHNGVEIYEGDIVQGFESTGEYPGEGFLYEAVVEWNKKQCAFQARMLGDDEVYPVNDFDFDKVIGNIYENPDLLQK